MGPKIAVFGPKNPGLRSKTADLGQKCRSWVQRSGLGSSMRLEATDDTQYESPPWEELAREQLQLSGEKAVTPDLFEGASEGEQGGMQEGGMQPGGMQPGGMQQGGGPTRCPAAGRA